MKKSFALILILLALSGCATGRNLSSPNYIPEWENKIINFPNPSETSAGYWTVKVFSAAAYGLERAILFPFAVVGNLVVNAYYVPTWPFRWLFRGDKRLIVWYPLFHVGEEVGSDFYSKAWNQDLR